jgi:hypothetical protein
MASTIKLLKEEIVLDECVISDSSDDGDDSDSCEDDVAVLDAAADEEDSHVEQGGQGYSLGDSDYNSGFIRKYMENYDGQCEHRRRTRNPVSVIHYEWMGGIGLKDQLLQMYLIERKRMHKWYMKT